MSWQVATGSTSRWPAKSEALKICWRLAKSSCGVVRDARSPARDSTMLRKPWLASLAVGDALRQ
jgi:hypothetical protein